LGSFSGPTRSRSVPLDERLPGELCAPEIFGHKHLLGRHGRRENVDERPSRERGPASRLGAGQERHLAPPIGIAANQFRQAPRIVLDGEMARREVLLKRAVRKRVDAHSTREKKSRRLRQVLDEARRPDVRVLAQVQQPID
jgi:hypothetical protein